ncbi:hypothetical protein [Phosphitispora sp. TUW77]|uniref:hypothetical protein n=1 Tax=Phosphitispora sp. TUW77 TaxID=3152361 RepID=UPI003AB447E8
MRASDIGQVIFKLLHETGKPDTIQLVPGQVISVQVKEVKGNTAVLSYQGKEITACLESEVPEGVNIKCLVEGEKNGRIVLKLLDSNKGNTDFLNNVLRGLGLKDNQANIRLIMEMIRQEMPLIPETARKLAAFASSQGIPEGDMRVLVFMQQNGIPLNRDMYQFARELLADIKFLSNEMLQMSAYNQKLAAEAGPETQLVRVAETLHQVLRNLVLNDTDGPETIAAKLMDIFSLQAGRPGNLSVSQPGYPEVRYLLQQNQQVPQAGTAQSMAPQTGAAQTGAVPSEVLPSEVLLSGTTQSGLPQPGTAASGPSQPGTASAETASSGAGQPGMKQNPVVPGTVEPSRTAASKTAARGTPVSGMPQGGTVPTGTGTSASQGGTVPSVVSGPELAPVEIPGFEAVLKGSQAGQRSPEVVPNIVQQDSMAGSERVYPHIMEALKEAGDQGQKTLITSLLEKLTELLGDKGGQENSELLQLTKSITDRLDFIRDFNNRTDMNRDNTLLMYSTINFEDKQEPLRLLINYHYDRENRKRDFSSCRVEVKLNTHSMGLVRCEIHVAERNLTMWFVTEDEKTCNTIEKLKGILAKRLENMKYNVNMLDTKVEKQESDLFVQEDNDMSGMFQVNLRV